jgi:hypothetical protein
VNLSLITAPSELHASKHAVSGRALLTTLACDCENITMQSDASKLQVSGDHTVLLRRLASTVCLPYIPGRVYLSGGAYDLAAILHIERVEKFATWLISPRICLIRSHRDARCLPIPTLGHTSERVGTCNTHVYAKDRRRKNFSCA